MTIANHSELLLKLDLQLFSDDLEDMILPDDFTPEVPEVPETPETIETPETPEAQPQAPETQETPAETLQALKIKYNHEEREIPLDEAIPLVQKGLNYDKLQERLQEFETDPRLEFVKTLAEEHGMDVNEYLDAVKQQREEARISDLVSQGISEEVAKELLETRKFREQLESERRTKAEEEKQSTEYNEFFDYFRQPNGRDFAADKDQIPAEVWQATQNGTPLKYAFMEHQMKQLQSKVQVLQHNEQVTQKAPVTGVTTHGSTEPAAEDLFMQGFNSVD